MKFLGVALLVLATCAADVGPALACDKAITFAVAENGGLNYRLPKVSANWFQKTQAKLPSICFSQFGVPPNNARYQVLIVLSTSRSSFNGLLPVFHTQTTAATTPVSETGTATNNYGETWDYTYQGTATTTTTTTTKTEVPYTDTIIGIYASAYSEKGALIGSSERHGSSREGGDPANTFGYNLAGRLRTIHVKEHLLEDIVKQIAASNLTDSGGSLPPVAALSDQSAPDKQADNYEALWLHAITGVSNIQKFALSRNIPLSIDEDSATLGTYICGKDRTSPECFDNWQLSKKAYAWLSELGSAMRAARSSNDELMNLTATDLNPTWIAIRDVYCHQLPTSFYTDLESKMASCSDSIATK